MARVILGVTGSVAAIRTPEIYAAISAQSHVVRVVATEVSLYFFDRSQLAAKREKHDRDEPADPVFRDCDEWPGHRYRRGDPVLHIEFRKWADLLVIAPLDANTLAKLALGLCDNFLTCLFRAWDFSRPVILAPAMNTLMWNSPLTVHHLGQLLLHHGGLRTLPDDFSLESAAEHFARHAPGIVLIPPQCKQLACGDVGMGAMGEVVQIADVVKNCLAAESLPSALTD